jgi:hypothetical protein
MDPLPEPLARWHRAVNSRDLDAVRAVTGRDVEIGGPRGTARGIDVLLDWVCSSGIRLEPTAVYPVDGRRTVVAQDATWPGRPDHVPGTAPVATAAFFEVRDGRVARVLRFDEGVEAALAAARNP